MSTTPPSPSAAKCPPAPVPDPSDVSMSSPCITHRGVQYMKRAIGQGHSCLCRCLQGHFSEDGSRNAMQATACIHDEKIVGKQER